MAEKFTQWPALGKRMFSREFIYYLIQYLQILLEIHNYEHKPDREHSH